MSARHRAHPLALLLAARCLLSGARVLPKGHGKWIAQKFKELPPDFRREERGCVGVVESVVLPPEAVVRGALAGAGGALARWSVATGSSRA